MNDLPTLRSFDETHVQQTFEWIVDPELRRMFLLRGDPSWNCHVAYWNKTILDPTQAVYAIYFKEKHVGNCGFKNIVAKQDAELWIYLGSPLVRGKGIGSSATSRLISEGFQSLNFRTIYLHVADFNTSACSLYKKLGFIEAPIKEENTDWGDRECKIIRLELSRKEP